MSRFKTLVDRLLGIAVPTFGECVEYRPKSGGAYSVIAVFDNEAELVDPDTETLVSANNPRIGVRLRDLETTPRQGDKVVAGGKLYRVIDVQEDGQGGASLFLHLRE